MSSHKPGAALDRLVATRVMQLDLSGKVEHDWQLTDDGKRNDWAFDADCHNGPVCLRCHHSFCVHCGETQPTLCEPVVPAYSTEILFAWEIVDRMRLSLVREPTENLWHAGQIANPFCYVGHGVVDARLDGWASAKSAPLAICLAALNIVTAKSE